MIDDTQNHSDNADPSQGADSASPEGGLDRTEKYVSDIAHKLQQALRYDQDDLNATAQLTGLGLLGRETLTLAVSLVLLEKFGIQLPEKILTDINTEKAVNYSVQNDDPALPPRTVAIILEPKRLLLSVHGNPGKQGQNGYSKLAFDWQRRPGRFDQTGIVDLKKLNTYPTIHENALLATIFHPTQGKPGVSCLGRKITQQTGTRR